MPKLTNADQARRGVWYYLDMTVCLKMFKWEYKYEDKVIDG